MDANMTCGYHSNTGRDIKARKILAVLENVIKDNIHSKRILDIGTGNGGIASYIATFCNDVTSVDIENNVDTNNSGFNWIKVENAILPFEREMFDIIISNMVIEHLPDQDIHLSEIFRVLASNGIVYFATPNRFFPFEAHTKLFLLHWLPKKIFYRTAKVLGKCHENIWLLHYLKMIKMFTKHGFVYEDYTIEILNNPQKYHLEHSIKIKIPQFMSCFSMTNVFVLRKKGSIS